MESETSKRLINRLRQLREHRGLTQEGLAERAGLMYKHYQAVEAGRKPDLRLSTLEKLANGLGLEPWELLLPATATPAVAEAQAKYGRKRLRSRRKK
ncbi:helix-turn-helix domain-containing protein [Horticoccus sp. 23ND18S-11]|uniref:helix-turn-helix domain-containing protein n=1 Tax=Horticoccus sp. 23ND18S-11 TaxID=3391832 RepID=UPI0039C9CD18